VPKITITNRTSNPNPKPTTKQHAVAKHSTKYSHMFYAYPGKFTRG